MEVAFFTDSYPPNHDGVSTVVSGLARALDRLGHGVRVFAPHPVKGAAPREEVIDGIPVIRARSIPVPFYAGYRWAVFPLPQLRGQGLRKEVDVLHLHSPGPMGATGFFAARRLGKPLVGTFHTNVWAMRDSFPDAWYTRLFFRTAWWYTLGTYWRCDRATAPTPEAAATLIAAARKPFKRPVEVVPNGIEVDRFRPGLERPDWRARCGLGPAPLVTYLGRLTQDKGIHRFLDAVARVAADRPVSAIIGGSGPEERSVRDRLAGAPLDRVARFVGPVAEEEKPSLLSQSDLFVLPSTSDTSSLSLLEAMASGATAVASDQGGLPAIIRDGVNGRLAPIDPPEALADTIAALLDDPATRRRLGTAGRTWVADSASIEACARRFITLYAQLLAGREHGRFGPAGARTPRPGRAVGG